MAPLGHPELWAQGPQPPMEAGQLDLRQEQLLQAELTVTGLTSRMGELRERRLALQMEFRPGASSLDLVGEELVQAKIKIAESQMAAVEAWLKAKKIEVDVLRQKQEVYNHYESTGRSEGEANPVKQVADARDLVAMLEGVHDDLRNLLDAWGSARHSCTEHLEVLGPSHRGFEDEEREQRSPAAVC